MPFIEIEGFPVHYKLHSGGPQPKGPPLVLVHGAGGSLMHWPGGLRRLPGHAVYGVDLPGHGHSGGPGRSAIADYAEIVHGLADELKLPRFVLAGHSMGGAIAQEFALRYAGRLAGLVLVGTGARLRVAPQVLSGIVTDHDATATMLAEWTHGDGADRNLLRLYARRLKEVPAQVLLRDFEACDVFDRRADVARIDAPALIICGEADRMTPVKYSQYLHDQIARSRLIVVPGAGHMVMLECPQDVTAAIAGFLDELSL